MAPTRRPAPTAAPPPPAQNLANFGDLGFYNVSQFILPPGEYIFYFNVKMHAYTKANGQQGVPGLGVMVDAYPIDGGETHEAFFRMGSKAHLSFAPDPNTGKSLVPIPNAPSAGAPVLTNWNMLLKSLYDCGLPAGVFTNDISVLDGVWVRTENVDPPEERKSFKAKTAVIPGQEEEDRGPQKVAIIAEILEGGKPWEGGGGMTAEAQAWLDGQQAAEAPAPPPVPAPRPGPRAVPAPAAPPTAPPARVAAPAPRRAAAPTPVAAPAPPAATEVAGEADLETVSLAVMSEVLAANPNGMTKVQFRIACHTSMTGKMGAEWAQALQDTYFITDEALTPMIGVLGFKVAGRNISR